MGLVILIVIGALLGWVGSIVFERERRSDILACMIGGIVGAIVGALVVGGVSLMSGIGAMQLLGAFVGGVLLVVAAHFAALNMGYPADR